MSQQKEYNSGEEMFNDLDPSRPEVKKVDPEAQRRALEKTRNSGMNHKDYPQRNINSPEN